MIRHGWILAVLAVASSAGLAVEDDPAKLLQTLFGEQIKAVSATPDAGDDVALAQQMLQTLETLEGSPALQRLVCEKVYEFTVRSPEALDEAVASMERLAQLDPDQTLDCHDRIVRALTIAHTRTRGEQRSDIAARLAGALETGGDLRTDGDDVGDSIRLYLRAQSLTDKSDDAGTQRLRGKIERARTRSQVMRRIEQYKLRIKNNPEDRKAGHELVMAYVVDLDQPVEAAKYSFLVEKQLADRVRLAEKPIDSVAPEACSDLAKWYVGLSSNRQSAARFAMLNRAARYYRRFIDSDPSDNVALTVARVKLTQIETQLAELSGVEGDDAKEGWRPLMAKDRLTGWRLPAEKGAYEYKDGVLMMGKDVVLSRPIGTANFALRGSFALAQIGAARIGFRGSEDTHYQIIVRHTVTRLVRYVRTSSRDIGSFRANLRPGEMHRFEIVAAGSRLIIKLDGEQIIDASDDEYGDPGALVLLAHSKEGGWKVSDLQVRELSKSEVAKYNKK